MTDLVDVIRIGSAGKRFVVCRLCSNLGIKCGFSESSLLTTSPMTTKVALVTGAARGIGRAIALRLADDGLDVAVNDLPNTPELDDVVREIESKGRRSLAVPADVSLEEDVEKIIQQVVQKLGSLDVVSPFDGQRDNLSQAPLHLASQRGHLDMARLLLDHGVDPNITRNDLWSPLQYI
jgi:hypothetical protein